MEPARRRSPVLLQHTDAKTNVVQTQAASRSALLQKPTPPSPNCNYQFLFFRAACGKSKCKNVGMAYFAVSGIQDCLQQKCSSQYKTCTSDVLGCAPKALSCANKCGEDANCLLSCAKASGNGKLLDL